MNQSQLLEQLNQDQEQAVRTTDINVLVDAGPGTGKTRVLTARISWLLDQGSPPERILAITFTNKAALEMSERISAAGLSRLVRITTFHSWAYRFLAEGFPAGKRPVVISESDQKRIFSSVCRSLDLPGKPAQGLERIQFLKQSHPPEIETESSQFRRLFHAYQDYLKAHGLLDYDDLIIDAVSALEKKRVVDPLFQPFDHLLIDEFQDVSPAQYRLCRLLAGPSCRVMAIGDPQQSIYGFRGSDPASMEKFVKDFSPCARIRLDTAYRCPQKFLDAASSVLGKEGTSKLKSAQKSQASIVFRQLRNHHSEAAWISSMIDRITGGVSFESLNRGTASGLHLRSLSDVAVLFRINRLGESITSELEKTGIPFQCARQSNPVSEKRLNILWHLTEFLEDRIPGYHLSMLDAKLQRQLGGLSADERRRLKNMHHEAFLDAVTEMTGMKYNLMEKAVVARALKLSRQGRPLTLALKTEQDCLDFRIEAVSVMSIHAAKGLEFPVVFIAGCERDILPWIDSDISEERRLFYVGLTRASEQIFLTAAGTRNFWGRSVKTGPSPFIEEIGPFLTKEKATRRKKGNKKPRQKKLF